MRTRYGVIPFSNQDQPCYSQLSNTILPSSLVDLPHVNVIQHLDDEIIRTRTLHYQPKECPHITQSSILVNGWWNFRYSASSTIKYYKLQLNYKYKLGISTVKCTSARKCLFLAASAGPKTDIFSLYTVQSIIYITSMLGPKFVVCNCKDAY